MWILVGVFAYFLFGWFAARMFLIDTMDFEDDDDRGAAWGFLAFGIAGWLIAMSACSENGTRRKAHFIPVFGLPSVNPTIKFFAVTPPKPDREAIIKQLEKEAGII